MKRLSHWLAIAAAISLIVVGYTILAPSRLPRLWQIKRQIQALETQNQLLSQQIEQLATEIELLSGDSEASLKHLEKVVRKELRFVGEGETLVLFDAPTKRASQ